MKIVVDQLPESPKYCLFAEVDARATGFGLWHKCQLSKTDCHFDYGDPCPFLITIEEVRNDYCN